MLSKKKIYINGEETIYSVTTDGRIFNDKTERELKGTYRSQEYKIVQLTINGKPKSCLVHRLVAEAFIPNPNNYPIVDHIDRDKLNNNVSNLRWADSYMNNKNTDKAHKYGKVDYYKGEIDDTWKLTLSDYLVNTQGIVINRRTKRILKGTLRNGYIRVYIKNKNYSVHILVWEAFKGPVPEGMVIDHINGNRADNRLENLRCVSQSENMYNAQNNGHVGQVKITQYDAQGNYIAAYDSMHLAAQAVGGNEIAIKSAANRHGKSAGYFWIRGDDNITIQEVLKVTHAGKPKDFYISVSQYDREGNFIAHYNSLKGAARIIGCSDSTIRRAADDKHLSKGYYWIIDNSDVNINDLLKG